MVVLISCEDKQVVSTSDDSNTSDQGTGEINMISLSAAQTGVDFVNRINDEGKINIFTWHFLYNGAGVAAGDINNDGLPDLYFTGNMVPDKLYLNKGDFKFEDITSNAGISTKIWSSGVTMADVNADGLMDIYVSKNSPTGNHDFNRNLLYINMGKNVFREQASQYRLDDIGFGVQASFFDADQDGDLDVYLVNQPFDEFARLVNRPDVVADYPQTNRILFFENGRFVDKTDALGMKNARYGLNVSLGDFDMNGWTDLYVCNDYHHADHLYMNTGGRFTDALHSRTGHISFYSMGSDVADVNQDGWLDLLTLDMAFEDHYRSKTNMGSMDRDRFWALVADHQHYQYMQNGLQLNMGHGYFSESAQLAGISKSDWSYATLFADLDLDSDQDILITNGVLRDLRNNDFQVYVKEKYQNQVGPENYLEVLKNIPSTPIKNVMFKNDGKGHFSKLPPESGFDIGSFSHGMAVADFDRDGKLDVVINNCNSPASIYRNVTETSGHYINIRLKGQGKNLNGLGCSVMVYAGGKKQINTMQTTRGYFSASEPILHFGLGLATIIDSIKVYWNHQHMSVLKNVDPDQELTINYAKEKHMPFAVDKIEEVHVEEKQICNHIHAETEFDDYDLQVLLPYKLSQNGPFIAVGDVNGDKADDFFIGGAAGNAGSIYLQQNGKLELSTQPAFTADKDAEDMEASFFDMDGDADLDLLVTSGSYEFKEGSVVLRTRLYINDGKGNFGAAAKSVFPSLNVNSQCIEIFDADGDNDMDIFIGGRLIAGKYPVPASSVMLINEGGKFSDKTKSLASFLENFGLVTDAVSDDIDKDGDADLLIVGEWMQPTWMINHGASGFTQQKIESGGTGLWWTIEKSDIDADGDADFILGNLGWNNKFGGSQGTKLEVFANDFDQNGDYDVVLANTKQDKLLPVRGRECSSQEMPFILNKFPSYESYAQAGLNEILTEDQLENSTHQKLSTMNSILLINNGNMDFSLMNLPSACQSGPVKALYADDFNKDGKQDFMYAGNHFPTEVETARYDGLFPGICFGDGKGQFKCQTMFINNRL
ncbi:MAG: VCBS repeat-containing protein, partial [Saprospiraceae bacterium]